MGWKKSVLIVGGGIITLFLLCKLCCSSKRGQAPPPETTTIEETARQSRLRTFSSPEALKTPQKDHQSEDCNDEDERYSADPDYIPGSIRSSRAASQVRNNDNQFFTLLNYAHRISHVDTKTPSNEQKSSAPNSTVRGEEEGLIADERTPRKSSLDTLRQNYENGKLPSIFNRGMNPLWGLFGYNRDQHTHSKVSASEVCPLFKDC